jgi:hypothetical protein
MFSIRFNALLDTSHYGPSHPRKVSGLVENSLTGIHNAKVKCLFVVNRSCRHRGFCVSPHVKIQRIQIWRGAWSPLRIHPPRQVLLGTSRTARTTIMHVPHSCSDTSSSSFDRLCGQEMSVAFVCKPMRQNMRAYSHRQSMTTQYCWTAAGV